MTQQQLGDELGITAQEVQNYEVGANQISASHMRDIVVAMEVPVSFFYEGLALALGEAA
jgi:transcriptional regulator with XRE-family HTH domain